MAEKIEIKFIGLEGNVAKFKTTGPSCGIFGTVDTMTERELHSTIPNWERPLDVTKEDIPAREPEEWERLNALELRKGLNAIQQKKAPKTVIDNPQVEKTFSDGSTYTTQQGTSKRIKLQKLFGSLLVPLGSLILVVGIFNAQPSILIAGIVISGLGIGLIQWAKLMKWWHHD